MTEVSGSIWLMQIFTGVPWRRGVKQQWGNRKSQFSVLPEAVFGALRNEANIR